MKIGVVPALSGPLRRRAWRPVGTNDWQTFEAVIGPRRSSAAQVATPTAIRDGELAEPAGTVGESHGEPSRMGTGAREAALTAGVVWPSLTGTQGSGLPVFARPSGCCPSARPLPFVMPATAYHMKNTRATMDIPMTRKSELLNTLTSPHW